MLLLLLLFLGHRIFLAFRSQTLLVAFDRLPFDEGRDFAGRESEQGFDVDVVCRFTQPIEFLLVLPDLVDPFRIPFACDVSHSPGTDRNDHEFRFHTVVMPHVLCDLEKRNDKKKEEGRRGRDARKMQTTVVSGVSENGKEKENERDRES